MPSPVEPAVQAEIDRRRAASERRFRDVVGGVDAPTLIHHGLTPDDVRRRFLQKGPGLLAVSLHTQAYFLLLLCLDRIGVPCTAITTAQLAARLKATGYRPTTDLRFETRLTPGLLRDCREGRRILFVMADVLTDRGPNMMAPVFGRAKVYTITWARLAARLGVDVLVAVCRDQGRVAHIHMNELKGPFTDAFTLTGEVFDGFRTALGDDLSIWEDEPAWARYSAPLPGGAPEDDVDLIRELQRYAACDDTVARGLLRTVRDAWPDGAPGSPVRETATA